ncbi:MAG: hypothetical protein F6J93_00605 [Oscillatoria sp. SIO1A7]|nr:hypothetical protein [Oscillatoria sp. SIO1A7]
MAIKGPILRVLTPSAFSRQLGTVENRSGSKPETSVLVGLSGSRPHSEN